MKLGYSSQNRHLENDTYKDHSYLKYNHNDSNIELNENDKYGLLEESNHDLSNSYVSLNGNKESQSSNWISGFLKPKSNSYGSLAANNKNIDNVKVLKDKKSEPLLITFEDAEDVYECAPKLELDSNKRDSSEAITSKWYHKNNISKAFTRRYSSPHPQPTQLDKFEKISKRENLNVRDFEDLLEENTSLINE